MPQVARPRCPTRLAPKAAMMFWRSKTTRVGIFEDVQTLPANLNRGPARTYVYNDEKTVNKCLSEKPPLRYALRAYVQARRSNVLPANVCYHPEAATLRFVSSRDVPGEHSAY